MIAALRGARAACVFLTRLPVGGFPYSEREWRWAAAWFPVVGALVGSLAASAWLALDGAGPHVAGVGALATGMLATGALHEDGLADTADAFGGASDRNGVLRILKDPRVGTFGALALIVSVLSRLVLLVTLAASAPAALVLAHGLGRVGPVWLLVGMPYVTGDAKRSGDVTRAGPTQAWAATAAGAALAAIGLVLGAVSAAEAALSAFAVAAVTLLCARRYRIRVGGVTGDLLGATEQLCEVAVLSALVLA